LSGSYGNTHADTDGHPECEVVHRDSQCHAHARANGRASATSPSSPADSTAIGCLWVLAIGQLMLGILAIVAIVSLIFLGGQVSTILSRVGESV